MSVIFILIPLALVLAALAVAAFLFAIRDGQFDELEAKGCAPLMDDPEVISDSHEA